MVQAKWESVERGLRTSQTGSATRLHNSTSRHTPQRTGEQGLAQITAHHQGSRVPRPRPPHTARLLSKTAYTL